jgi:hypothetical protein
MNLRVILEVGAAIAMAAGAVAAYHKFDNAGLVESLDNIESGVIVDRIVRLNKRVCKGGLPEDLEAIRQQQLARYHDLTGREFTQPSCKTD